MTLAVPFMQPLRTFLLLLLIVSRMEFATAQTSAPTSSPLRHPAGVAVDKATGTIYFAERDAHRVRRLTVAGVLETVAGDGTQGNDGDGGPAILAQLNSPDGVAIDAAGNVYVADTGNHRVRMINAASGAILPVAGSGTAGFSGDGGAAAQARLYRPRGVAVSPEGNVAVLDSGNQRIRLVNPSTGSISTLVGTGLQGPAADGVTGLATTLNEPSAVAYDSAGNLYIADNGNRAVRMLDAKSHLVRTILAASASSPLSPVAVASDGAGNLFISDGTAHQLLRWEAATGLLRVIAGSGIQAFAGDGSNAGQAAMDAPAGLGISAGSLIVADSANNRLRSIDLRANAVPIIQTIAGGDASTLSTLTLTGPATVIYGSGVVQVGLSSASSASPSGTVTLLEITGGTATTLAQAAISQGAAALSLEEMRVGNHQLRASFSGSGQPALTSSSISVSVTPRDITAAPQSAAMLFGQPPPALAGSLTGLLARDAATVQGAFSAEVSVTSPPGVYPVHVVLLGTAASNYAVTASPAALTISKAPSLVSLSPTTLGQNFVAVRAASTTTGVPTGPAVLYDSGNPIASASLSVDGSWTVDVSSLTPGSHRLSATYAGDGNFLPSAAAPIDWTVPGAALTGTPNAVDFTLSLASTTSPVNVLAGDTASASFVMSPVHGQLSGPVLLSVSGLPAYASGNFDPPVLPAGNGTVPFTLHIATTPVAAKGAERRNLLLIALLLPLGMMLPARNPRSWKFSIVCLICLVALTGCGDRIATTGGAAAPSTSNYTVVVTGTATAADGTTLQHSAQFVLQVQR